MQISYHVKDAAPYGTGKLGSCTHCGNPASKQVHFEEDGGTVIERYCDDCIKPDVFERLQKRYGRN